MSGRSASPDERSALLPKAAVATAAVSSSVAGNSNSYGSDDDDDDDDDGDGVAAGSSDETVQPPYRLWLAEIWLLTKASVPVILAYTLQNSLQTVSVLMVGRLSPEALATAAFSYMFAMATAWLIALGGTTALDTLASSSFTGSANKHDLGILLQRGLVILTGFYALVSVLWWFSEHVFRALGQEEFICVQSAMFLRCLIPGGLGYICFEAMKKFLQAQGESAALLPVLLFSGSPSPPFPPR